jgi:hypothetical protein
MPATATLEDGRIVLRSYDHGQVFAVVLGPMAALILAGDLLDAAIAVQQRTGPHDAGQLEAAPEQLVAGREHNENI